MDNFTFPLLITGKSNSGKSFYCNKTFAPFTIHSTELLNLDNLYLHLLNIFRENIQFVYTNSYEVIEGEVFKITHNSVTLKNNDMVSSYNITRQFREQMVKENIKINDFMQFNIFTGKITKLNSINLDNELIKNVEISQSATVNAMDQLNANLTPLHADLIPLNIIETTNQFIKKELKNKSQLTPLNILIEDIHLLNNKELKIIYDLFFIKYKPNIIFTANKDLIENRNEFKRFIERCTVKELEEVFDGKRLVAEKVIEYVEDKKISVEKIVSEWFN